MRSRPRRPRGLRRPARRLRPRAGSARRSSRSPHRACACTRSPATARPGRCWPTRGSRRARRATPRAPTCPSEYRPYLRTMQEQDGPGHLRLRRAVAPAFTPRRVERFRARIAELVDGLLDDVAGTRGRRAATSSRPRPPAADGGDLRGDRRARRGPTAVARVRRHGLGGRRAGLRRRDPRDHRRRQGRAGLGATGRRPRHRPRPARARWTTPRSSRSSGTSCSRARCPPTSSRSASTPSSATPTSSPRCRDRPRRRRRGAAALVRPAAARRAPLPERGRRRRGCADRRGHPGDRRARRRQPRPARLPRSRRARRRPRRRRPPRVPARPALLPRRRPRPAGDRDRAHRGTATGGRTCAPARPSARPIRQRGGSPRSPPSSDPRRGASADSAAVFQTVTRSAIASAARSPTATETREAAAT